MNPELFAILKANPAVTALLGTSPLRVYPWGRAPQEPLKPYVAYGVYNGLPENYLGQTPDIDNKGTQIDIYAKTAASAEAVFIAIRDAVEPFAHMTNFSTPALDANTDLYTGRMEFDFWDER